MEFLITVSSQKASSLPRSRSEQLRRGFYKMDGVWLRVARMGEVVRGGAADDARANDDGRAGL